jgi:hypothetical protein
MSEYDDICNDVASSLESDFIRLETVKIVVDVAVAFAY